MVDPNIQQLIKSAQTALRKDDKAEARRLLFQVVSADHNNETAWMILSDLMDMRYERINCLEKVLEINPFNIEAQAYLEELRAGPTGELQHEPTVPAPPAPPEPVPAGEADLRSEFAEELRTTDYPPAAGAARPTLFAGPDSRRGLSRPQIVILAVLGLATALCVIFVGLFVLPNMVASLLLPKKTTPAAQLILPSATLEKLAEATQATLATPTRSQSARITIYPTATPRAAAQVTRTAPAASTTRVNTLTPTLGVGMIRPLLLTQAIGPIQDAGQKQYTLQITIDAVRFTMGTAREPRTGDFRYIVIDLTILNRGPDAAEGIGNFGFHLKDNQEIRNPTMLVEMAKACFLGTQDLEVEQSNSGCIAFEVTKMGPLELIYTPLWDQPDFFISFTLR